MTGRTVLQDLRKGPFFWQEIFFQIWNEYSKENNFNEVVNEVIIQTLIRYTFSSKSQLHAAFVLIALFLFLLHYACTKGPINCCEKVMLALS